MASTGNPTYLTTTPLHRLIHQTVSRTTLPTPHNHNQSCHLNTGRGWKGAYVASSGINALPRPQARRDGYGSSSAGQEPVNGPGYRKVGLKNGQLSTQARPVI